MLFAASAGYEIATFSDDLFRNMLAVFSCSLATIIGFLHDIIISLGTARFLTDDFFLSFSRRFGLLLGLFMLFKLIFVLINYLIDPDKTKDSKTGAGKIITRVIVVIVLIATYNNIFSLAYDLQLKAVNSPLIPRLFWGDDSYTVEHYDEVKFIMKYAGVIPFLDVPSTGEPLFTMEEFATLIKGDGISLNTARADITARATIKTLALMKSNVVVNKIGEYIKENISESIGNFIMSSERVVASILGPVLYPSSTYTLQFHGVLSSILCIFILVAMLTYAIKLGMRVIQMAILQLIAPVPIISYISPTDDSLKKWFKMVVSCYIEVFVMIAIFYFIGYATMQIQYATTFNFLAPNLVVSGFVKAILLIALLLIGKKAPDLLKRIFNLDSDGTYGFSLKKTLAPIDPLIKKTRTEASAVGGGVAGAIGAIRAGGKGGDVAHAIWKGSVDGRKSGRFLTSLAAGFTYGRDVGAEIGTVESRIGQTISEEEIKDSMRRKTRGLPTAAEEKDYEKKSYASLNDYLSQMDSISKAGFVSTFYDDNSDEYGVRTITDLMAKARIESTLGGSTESYDKLLEYSNDESSEYHALAKKALTGENAKKLKSADSAIFQYAAQARAEIKDIHSRKYDKIVVNGEVVNDFGYLDAKSYSRIKKNSKIAKNAIELDPNQIRNVEVDKIADKRLKRSTFTAFWSSMGRKGGHGAPPSPPPRH